LVLTPPPPQVTTDHRVHIGLTGTERNPTSDEAES
jgi:hypothetical protein